MKKVKRVKVSVRPSALHDDARIAEVTSPDGKASLLVSFGYVNGHLLVDAYRHEGAIVFRGTVAVEHCPVCKAATHASESDDLGRCGPCAERVGAPHAGVQS